VVTAAVTDVRQIAADIGETGLLRVEADRSAFDATSSTSFIARSRKRQKLEARCAAVLDMNQAKSKEGKG
jgi:hypothetical protein